MDSLESAPLPERGASFQHTAPVIFLTEKQKVTEINFRTDPMTIDGATHFVKYWDIPVYQDYIVQLRAVLGEDWLEGSGYILRSKARPETVAAAISRVFRDHLLEDKPIIVLCTKHGQLAMVSWTWRAS